jgi:hypothetical protein
MPAPADRRPATKGWGWLAGLTAVCLLTPAVTVSAGNILDWLFHHDVQVITSTDALPAGALLRPPSQSAPVYYVAMDAGYRDFGSAMAGEKPPAPKAMVGVIVRTLAKAGFLPADPRHPPSELLVFAWGTLYPTTMPNPNGPDLPDVQVNRVQMVTFLGGDKLGLVPDAADVWNGTEMPGLTRFNPDAQAIADAARDDLYVVALAGYEWPVKARHRPVLLWRTKISCPALGLAMADTLPTMLAIAAPYIGHETGAPVWVNASDQFKPAVHVGNPKFEEYLDATPVTVIQQPSARSKTGK